MNILGIESSCDETAAAVVRDDGVVLSNIVASQVDEHAPYGGIVPELASRAHMRAAVVVVEQAIAPLPSGWDSVDAIAVTRGPGLTGSLLVGAQIAKALAWSLNKPLLTVDHLNAHLLSAFLRFDDEHRPPQFPFVGLLVSGGHTALYRVDDHDTIALLGQTRDDAVGEAFDKVASLLGLGYPGGPIVDRLAADADPSVHDFPLPLPKRDSLEFSFSGLKTAIVRHIDKHGAPQSERALKELCASFQRVAVTSLVKKAMAACAQQEVSELVVVGGVAANSGLRQLASTEAAAHAVTLTVPPLCACTDNAAMVAYAAAHRLRRGESDGIDFDVYSRDPARRRGKFRPDGRHVPRTG